MYRSLTSLVVTISMVGSFCAPLAAEAAARPSPKKVLESLLTMPEPPLMAVTGEVTITNNVTPPKKKNKNDLNYLYPKTSDVFKIGWESYSDNRDEAILKSYGSVRLNSPQYSIDANLNYVAIDKTYYFQIPNKTVMNYFKEFAVSSTPTIDEQTWYKIDFKAIADELRQFSTNDADTFDKASDLTVEQKKQIEKLIINSGAISLSFKKEEVFNDVPVYTYVLNINKNRIMPVLRELMMVIRGKKLSKDEEKNGLAFFKKIKKLPVITISVFKNNLYPARILVTYASSDKNTAGYIVDTRIVSSMVFDYPASIASVVEPPNTVNLITLYQEYSKKYSSTYGGVSIVPNPYSSGSSTASNLNDTYRIGDLKRLQTGLELYYTDYAKYPAGASLVLGGDQAQCLNFAGFQPVNCSNPYLSYIYKDPGSYSYVYNALNSGTDYVVYATLEGIKDGLSGTIQLKPNGITKR